MRSKRFYQDLHLGIIGGGQLGRMLIQSCIDYNVMVFVLDPDEEAPCKNICHQFTKGSLTDFDSVYAFGKELDLVTIEIENVNADALQALENDGVTVYPQPSVLKTIQDKRKQKEFFRKHDIPAPDYVLVESRKDLENHIDFLPAFQKIGKSGYDGRGVQKLKSKEDINKGFDTPGLLEKFVDIKHEISIIVARNKNGKINTFPAIELVFNQELNLVEHLIAPAKIDSSLAQKASDIAEKLISQLKLVGILTVEMFITSEEEILVNEVAPRPHNSGHHTIEANVTSQYEQHLRTILNLPLGYTDTVRQAAMVNLIGQDGYNGIVRYEGLEEVMQIDGVYPHIYGKKFTKPSRKMGHITITDEDYNALLKKISIVKKTVSVIS